MVSEKFDAWFSDCDPWQKDLLNHIFLKDYSELNSIFKTYIDNNSDDLSNYNLDKPEMALDFSTDKCVKFKQITNILNLGAIKESKLIFGNNLCLVYGGNGCGKSTYLNFVKNICGVKQKKDILGNIFEDSQKTTGTVVFSISDREETFQWNNSICKDLVGIDVFDSDYSARLLSNKVSFQYKPRIIESLDELSKSYNEFKTFIDSQISNLNNTLNLIPNNIKNELLIIKFLNEKNINDLDAYSLLWDKEFEDEYNEYQEQLNIPNPDEEINHNVTILSLVDELFINYKDKTDQYADEVFDELLILRENVKSCEKICSEAANILSKSDFNGIGSETWKELWISAKLYSEKYVYPGIVFPQYNSSNHCVLCHQPLCPDAIERMVRLEKYVNSNLESNLNKAVIDLNNKLDEFDAINSWESINKQLGLCKLDKNVILKINLIHSNLVLRYNDLKNESLSALSCKIFRKGLISLIFNQIITDLKEKINNLELLKSNRAEIVNKFNSQDAKKWLATNANIDIRKNILKLNILKNSISTRSISDLVREIYDEYTKNGFTKYFDDILKDLGASSEHVKMKIRSETGDPKFEIIFDSTGHKVKDILSEGEKKAISFAVYIAEMNFRGWNMPLIFDDPTNSLDNEYEEKIAKKLIDLSKKHQVIIFTHRLPLIYYITEDEYAGTINYISLLNEPTGSPDIYSGLFTDALRDSNKIDASLKKLVTNVEALPSMSDNMMIIKKASICNTFRKLIEVVVEKKILSNVVSRYGREIRTQNLVNIKKINDNDIKIITELMTDYSYTEHSQPGEAPFQTYKAERICADIKKLLDLLKSFESRERIISDEKTKIMSKYDDSI